MRSDEEDMRSDEEVMGSDEEVMGSYEEVMRLDEEETRSEEDMSSEEEDKRLTEVKVGIQVQHASVTLLTNRSLIPDFIKSKARGAGTEHSRNDFS